MVAITFTLKYQQLMLMASLINRQKVMALTSQEFQTLQQAYRQPTPTKMFLFSGLHLLIKDQLSPPSKL